MLHHSGERHLKSEISNLQVEKSVLESRISGLLSTRASEKVGNTVRLSERQKGISENRTDLVEEHNLQIILM